MDTKTNETQPVFNCLCAYVSLDVIYELAVILFIVLWSVDVAKLTAFTMATEWAVGLIAICMHVCALWQSSHQLNLSFKQHETSIDLHCGKALLSAVCIFVALYVLLGTVPPVPDITHAQSSLNFWILVVSSYLMGFGLIVTK